MWKNEQQKTKKRCHSSQACMVFCNFKHLGVRSFSTKNRAAGACFSSKGLISDVFKGPPFFIEGSFF